MACSNDDDGGDYGGDDDGGVGESTTSKVTDGVDESEQS